MKDNNIKKTILDQEMAVAKTPGEAWYNGTQYFLATEAEAYKCLGKEQLAALLRSARSLQKENGYVQLFEDPTMPGDARVDIIHKPSYATATIAIYAKLNFPEILDENLDHMLHNLLERALQHGIIGHGIEHEETVRRTLLMMCKAGLRSFLKECGVKFPLFSRTINRHMKHFIELAKRIDEDRLVVTANGFATESINHLIKELVAYWNGNSQPVFVYGTLMKGERANRMLASGEFAGFFQLKDYAMYNLGAYPGIKPCIGESVLGELYFVNPETVARLDEYEGEGSLYKRTTVQLNTGNKKFAAEAYVYNRNLAGCRQMREAWNARDNDLVWYAGYGSNLSRNRFNCYISGGTCAENGRTYCGASDPTPPRAEMKCSYHGKLYFGNNSSSWGGCGVAFFDPNPKNKDERVYMKRYLISRRQLHDVMVQEGQSPNWYGRLVCLEVDSHGIPVYTLTSEKIRPEKAPSQSYLNLIATVLRDEFNLKEYQIAGYLGQKIKH